MNFTIRLTKVKYEVPKDFQRTGNRHKKRMGEKIKEELHGDYSSQF